MYNTKIILAHLVKLVNTADSKFVSDNEYWFKSNIIQ